MSSYLLGIDIGTSSCKAAVFDRAGLVKASVSVKYPVIYQHHGWAEQDPEAWWQAVCQALKKLWDRGGVRPEEIACIGVDGQSWSAIPIDRDGRCLANTPIWMDFRSQDICDRINERVGKDRIFELAGNSLTPNYTTPKVIWYKENLPEVYAKTDKILQSNGFIVFRLTGEVSQDVCQGYGWHCFNMREGKWDPEMARELGIPEGFLPPIAACDQIVGRVTSAAAEATGLCVGTPVIAGGLDAATSTLGAGVIHPGETQEQGGQAGGMSICLDKYSADPRLILSFHVIPGMWLLQGGPVGGGSVLGWFEREFGDYERDHADETGLSSFDQLNRIAAKVPAASEGTIFLPYMSGERTPIWDPKAKGVFYGLNFATTKGHMARACMEGVAYALRHNIDVAESAGAHAEILRAVGGSANSPVWMQIKADVTQKPVVVPYSDTAATLGVVMLAGVACGMYASYDEAVALTVRETASYKPNPDNREIYDQAYQTYRDLYMDLKDLMNRG